MYLLHSDISVTLFFKIKVHEWKQDEDKQCCTMLKEKKKIKIDFYTYFDVLCLTEYFQNHDGKLALLQIHSNS